MTDRTELSEADNWKWIGVASANAALFLGLAIWVRSLPPADEYLRGTAALALLLAGLGVALFLRSWNPKFAFGPKSERPQLDDQLGEPDLAIL